MKLQRMGDGVYATLDLDYFVQNPHKMDPKDKDKQWYILDNEGNIAAGPLDTLRECRQRLNKLPCT